MKIKYSIPYFSPSEIENLPPKYDIYISGSDQIWNPNMAFDNRPYLLSFVPNTGKRIAYASSFGVECLPAKVMGLYKKSLEKYECISTREDAGKKLIGELIGVDVEVVLDPVFLLSAENWLRLMDDDYTKRGDYVLVYSLHKNDVLLSCAVEMAKKLNYKVILVNADYNTCCGAGVLHARDAGPCQWLTLIKHAKLFLTDSFHGTAFATIFGVPFLTFCKDSSKTNDRVYSLLSRFGLDSHIVMGSAKISFDIFIEKAYFGIERCSDAIVEYRKKSIEFLLHALL